MAKRKITEKDIKHWPRRFEKWEDTAADPVPTYTLKTYNDRGGHKTWTVTKFWHDAQGNPHEETADIPLLKFGEPGMRMVDDSQAEEEFDGDASDPATPSVTVTPIKGGLQFTCPGQTCGDKHEFTFDSTSYPDFSEKFAQAHANFVTRHADHMFDGTLFARRGE